MKCPICGARGQTWFNLHDLSGAVPQDISFNIARCDACECSYQNPMPTPELLTQAYSGSYYAYDEKPRSPEDVAAPTPWNLLEYFKPFFRRNHVHLLREELMWAIPDGATMKTFLDVGCGSGQYTVAAAQLYPHAKMVGQDEFLQYCQPVAAPNVEYVKTLDECAERGMTFDVIMLRNVLEHFTDPSLVFEKLAKISTPQTKMFIQTPNFHAFDRKLFGKLWFGFEIPRHTIIFSKKSLTRFAADRGWKLAKYRTHFVPSAWLYYLSLDYVSRYYLAKPLPRRYWKFMIPVTSLLTLLAAPFKRGGDIEAVLTIKT